MSPPLLLRSTCANYLLSQLHNQAFASTFPMGPYVKLECAVQEAFLMDSPESSLGCTWASALLSCMCHQGANPHCGAFGVCCPSPTQLLGRTLNPVLYESIGRHTQLWPWLGQKRLLESVERGRKSSRAGNASLSPVLDPLVKCIAQASNLIN